MSTAATLHPTTPATGTAPTSRALALAPSALMLPGSLGNIDSYIQAVNRIPLLSAEEEQSLAKRLRENDDLEAARQLVQIGRAHV